MKILVDADRQGTSSDWFSERCETNLPKLECMNKFDNIKQSLFDLPKRAKNPSVQGGDG